MTQAATIKRLPRAFRTMKAMQAHGIERGGDYRRAESQALKEVLEVRTATGIDRHLKEMDRLGAAVWRNGSYRRSLSTAATVRSPSMTTADAATPMPNRTAPCGTVVKQLDAPVVDRLPIIDLAPRSRMFRA